MATILFAGSLDHYRPLIESIDQGHQLYLFDIFEESVTTESEGMTLLSDIEDLPMDLDAIFDLEMTGGLSGVYDHLAETGSLFSSSLLSTATGAAATVGNGATVIGISYIPALFQSGSLLEVAPAMQNTAEGSQRAVELLRSLFPGKEVEVLADRLGLVSARTLAMIINEAAFAVMEGVASAEDIDLAMKLGTSYPEGPLRWVDTIGAERIVNLLDGLQAEYGEERYRPCVLLRQMARASSRFHSSQPTS